MDEDRPSISWTDSDDGPLKYKNVDEGERVDRWTKVRPQRPALDVTLLLLNLTFGYPILKKISKNVIFIIFENPISSFWFVDN